MKFFLTSSITVIASLALSAFALPQNTTGHVNATTLDKRQQYYSGIATYYVPNGGLGACGWAIQNTDQAVALGPTLYANGAHCGEWITVWQNSDPSNSQAYQVADLCPGCQGTYGIDLVQNGFQEFADLSVGVLDVTYFVQ